MALVNLMPKTKKTTFKKGKRDKKNSFEILPLRFFFAFKKNGKIKIEATTNLRNIRLKTGISCKLIFVIEGAIPQKAAANKTDIIANL